MKIYLQEIPEGQSTRPLSSLFDEAQQSDTGVAAPVTGNLVIERSGMSMFMSVEYSSTVSLSCSRCLEDFDLAVSGVFETSAAEVSRANEDTEFRFQESDVAIDITSAVYDDLLINLPIMPLCSPDCKGVAADASVAEKLIDHRWEALAHLKKNV